MNEEASLSLRFLFPEYPAGTESRPVGGTYYQAQQSYSVHNSLPAAVVGRSSRIVEQGFRKSSARAVVKLDHAWGTIVVKFLSSRPLVQAALRESSGVLGGQCLHRIGGERVSKTGQTKGWQRLACPKLCAFCKRVSPERSKQFAVKQAIQTNFRVRAFLRT
jgi:hypothetical protein